MKELEGELMPDEHMCKWCKKHDNCLERKRVEEEGDIVVDCAGFDEIATNHHTYNIKQDIPFKQELKCY